MFGAIIRRLVQPGTRGPVILGDVTATILTDSNAGRRLIRHAGETEEAFHRRINEAMETRLLWA